jgi:hypothetical protein
MSEDLDSVSQAITRADNSRGANGDADLVDLSSSEHTSGGASETADLVPAKHTRSASANAVHQFINSKLKPVQGMVCETPGVSSLGQVFRNMEAQNFVPQQHHYPCVWDDRSGRFRTERNGESSWPCSLTKTQKTS